MATEKTALDHLLDAMTHLVSMNDSSLEQLQEIVDYIKENADGLEEIEISQIIGLEDALATKVDIASVVDNLISTLTTAPLSANQGRVLNEKIQTISTAIETIKSVISSDDTSLDELQEIVNYIKQNKEDLANLDLSNIAETSTLKHFTKEMSEKLEGIEEGATNYELPETLPIEKIDGLQNSLDLKIDKKELNKLFDELSKNGRFTAILHYISGNTVSGKSFTKEVIGNYHLNNDRVFIDFSNRLIFGSEAKEISIVKIEGLPFIANTYSSHGSYYGRGIQWKYKLLTSANFMTNVFIEKNTNILKFVAERTDTFYSGSPSFCTNDKQCFLANVSISYQIKK